MGHKAYLAFKRSKVPQAHPQHPTPTLLTLFSLNATGIKGMTDMKALLPLESWTHQTTTVLRTEACGNSLFGGHKILKGCREVNQVNPPMDIGCREL